MSWLLKYVAWPKLWVWCVHYERGRLCSKGGWKNCRSCDRILVSVILHQCISFQRHISNNLTIYCRTGTLGPQSERSQKRITHGIAVWNHCCQKCIRSLAWEMSRCYCRSSSEKAASNTLAVYLVKLNRKYAHHRSSNSLKTFQIQFHFPVKSRVTAHVTRSGNVHHVLA